MLLSDPTLAAQGHAEAASQAAPARAGLAARLALGIAAGLALLALAGLLPARDGLGRSLPLSLALGAAFGLVLQRARFCFWCLWRDWLERRDPSGPLAVLTALAVGAIGYAVIFGAWMPNPGAGRLPPDAHIGPVSLTLALGAFAFGLGMAISGSCVSAHLYRLGEGAFGSIVALLGVAGGFVLGFLSWNSLYLLDLYRAPVIWLPRYLGLGAGLAVSLALIGLLAALVLRHPFLPQALHAPGPAGLQAWQAVFGRRWPPVLSGVLVGLIATLAYFRLGPLGVTAEIGSLARSGAAWAGWLPAVLQGLDGFAGCATVIKETLLSRNGVFVIAMVLAAALAAALSGDWRPSWPRRGRDLARLFGGGLLLGWGAMVSLGCTVGVLLSGIMAGALSGWVFTLFCLIGAWAGWHLRKRLG